MIGPSQTQSNGVASGKQLSTYSYTAPARGLADSSTHVHEPLSSGAPVSSKGRGAREGDEVNGPGKESKRESADWIPWLCGAFI